MWIAEVSIKRPVFAVMLISTLVGLGWLSFGRIGVDLFPKVEFPVVTVTTSLVGASPETIETEITDKIEEQVNTISGIDQLRSSSYEGLSQVFVGFELQEKIDIKAQDVRDKVGIAIRDLPQDTKAPVIEKVDPDSDPIMSIIISGTMPIRDLTHYADKTVKERLERISGVGSIRLIGGLNRKIRIWLDAQRLRAYSLTSEDVIRAIQSEHTDMPGGKLETNGKHAEFAVKTKGEVKRVEDFGGIVVAFRQGAPTFVRDVARVEDGTEDELSYADLDGKRGVSLEVRRQSGRNTVDVARAVRQALDSMKQSAPAGTEIKIARDNARFIESSARDVADDMIIGIILVVAITFAFLMSKRATAIVALAMPTSIVATFFSFYVMGFTFNMLTLMALSVSIGLLVDDAIVVLEAIHRELEDGKPPMQAAIAGVARVGFAVMAATISVIAVFTPIAFMSGIVGRFFFEYGLAVVFSVAVSFIVSVTLTPMLCSRFLGLDHHPGPTKRAFSAFHEGMEAYYAVALDWALAHRGLVMALAFATIIFGGVIARFVPVEFQSKADRSEFLANLELPIGTGIAETKMIAANVSAAIRQVGDVQTVFTTIGSGAQPKANQATFYIGLSPKQGRRITHLAIMPKVRAAMQASAPGAKTINVVEIPWIGGGGFSQSDVEYALVGPNLDQLQIYATQLAEKMKASGQFVDLQTSYEANRPEVQVLIDRERAADLGISVRTLASTVRTMIGGVDAGGFEENGYRSDIRVQLEESQRTDIDRLNLLQVRSGNGALVDLPSVASLKIAAGPAQIDRQNRSRRISVFANLGPGLTLGPAIPAIDALVAEMKLPPGYTGSHEGQAKRMKESGTAIGSAFILALVALYMILASQFNSFAQPAVVMLTAPLSFVGAFAALALTQTPSSMFAQIGMIALMGLVMKNGILLVDYANQLRDQGLSAHEAIRQAAPVRMRPVLMTQVATIMGMIPVTISSSDGAEFRAPMGVLVIGGLLSSTVLTLVVVPAAYSLMDQGLAAISGWRRYVFPSPVLPPPAPSIGVGED
jgi:HAE1 family hydrophobic/amphiphilic exporter-1